MVLMKKGNDTKYVADIFIPNYLSRGYEVIFPKKKAETPAPVVVEEKPKEEQQLDKVAEAPTVKEETETTEPVVAEAESEPAAKPAEVVEAQPADAKPTDTAQTAEAPSEKKSMSCPICGKQYAKKAYLLKHIEKEHPED